MIPSNNEEKDQLLQIATPQERRSERLNNIILIGFMGSGKSSIGKRLAQELRYEYIDTDAVIVKNNNLSIAEIFEVHGEEAFRKLESEALKTLFGKEKTVLATGGGIVLHAENQELLRRLGTVIWLHASVDTLFERAQRNTYRPLLEVEHPRHTFNDLLTRRLSAYQKTSDIFIDTTNLSYAQTKTSIMNALSSDFSDKILA